MISRTMERLLRHISERSTTSCLTSTFLLVLVPLRIMIRRLLCSVCFLIWDLFLMMCVWASRRSPRLFWLVQTLGRTTRRRDVLWPAAPASVRRAQATAGQPLRVVDALVRLRILVLAQWSFAHTRTSQFHSLWSDSQTHPACCRVCGHASARGNQAAPRIAHSLEQFADVRVADQRRLCASGQ